MNNWGLSELERRLANLVRVGVIDQVDHAARKVRVSAGGMITAWLPWPAEVGRNFKRWRPLRPGQQVVLVAPSGELSQALVVGMLYSDSLDSPSENPDLDLIEFEDGTRVEYDSVAHALKIDCAGAVTVKSPDLITLDSPQTTATGALTVQGLLSYQSGLQGSGAATVSGGDISADGISLKAHTHPGDSGGSTGPAQ